MDWFLTHWQAILAVIVAIGTPIVAILVVAILGWPLLRWFGCAAPALLTQHQCGEGISPATRSRAMLIEGWLFTADPCVLESDPSKRTPRPNLNNVQCAGSWIFRKYNFLQNATSIACFALLGPSGIVDFHNFFASP